MASYHRVLRKIQFDLSQILGIDESEISEGSKFTEALDADDWDIACLTVGLEECYRVDLTADDLDKVETVGQLAEVVSLKTARPPKT